MRLLETKQHLKYVATLPCNLSSLILRSLNDHNFSLANLTVWDEL